MDNTTATKRVASTKPLFTRRLPDKCLVSIATHKYVSGTYTPLDNFLNSFWLSCANLLPLWIAPNMVTLIGLGFNFLAFYLITTETNGTFEGPIRPWVNVVCGLCLFAYQTLDAMDGKHARATQNSTPLGQLFDHGCDALSCPMMSLTLASCIQLGPTKLIAYSVLAGQVPFFLAQWAESKTGALQHSLLGLFGVTETQLVFVSIHVASAFLPHTFWTNTVGDLGAVGYPGILLTPNLILVFGVIIPGALMMGLNQLLTTPATGSHYVQLMGALLPSFGTLLFLRTDHGLAMFVEHPIYITVTLAITMTYMTTQMIVLNMGHGDFDKIQPTAWLQVSHLYLFHHFKEEIAIQGTATFETCFQIVLAATVVFYMAWSIDAIYEICHVLNINCLTINPPPGSKKKK